MKKSLQIVLILLLLALIVAQILIAKGVFAPRKEINVCPVGAISIEHGKAVIDSIKCIGCRRCVDPFAVPADYESTAGLTVDMPLMEPAVSTPAEEEPSSPLLSSQNSSKPVAKPLEESTSTQSEADSIRYEVNPNQCISCRLCVMNCPVQAIQMVNGKAVIDQDKCIDCGICANGTGDDFAGCPTRAISKTAISPSSKP